MRAGALIPVLLVLVACSAHVGRAGGSSPAGPTGTIAVIGGGGARRIQLVSPASGATQRVNAPDEVVGLALSPAGDQIAFTGLTAMWVMNRDGTEARRIRDERGTQALAGALDWSTDGRRLVFVVAGSLFIATAEGKGAKRVTGHADAPDWAGEQILFVRNPDMSSRNGAISAIRADGSGLRRVIARGTWYGPRVSPDGSKVAFYRNGFRGVYVAPLRGGAPRLLDRSGTQPVWSPDGRYLAFARETNCSGEVCSSRIVVIPAAGGKARAIGPAIADIGALSWSR